MTLDIDNDISLADGSESVTVTLKRADGDTALAVVGALRRVLDRSYQSFGGVALIGDELVWNVPDNQLAGAELQRGDTITDAASISWTILAAEKLTIATRWRCLCRKEQ